MKDREQVIRKIYSAFEENDYPGDDYLQGSWEGTEPYDEVGPFMGKQDWKSLEPAFLDSHAEALSFFSEAGFRFYLPAYLVADLRGVLLHADPLFHLTHGFSDFSVTVPTKHGDFEIRSGRSVFVNPRRYGAMTFQDYARYRLSVFTREEAEAIAEYLRFQMESDQDGIRRDEIRAALDSFWLKRAESAPTHEELRRFLEEKENYLKAIQDRDES